LAAVGAAAEDEAVVAAAEDEAAVDTKN